MIGEPCETCNNKYPIRREYLNAEKIWICDRCGAADKDGLPDVYFDGKPEINLADDPNTGKPRVFTSKRDKAIYLKSRGIREAGDKHHGAFASATSPRGTTDIRPEIRNILSQWRGMGRDRQKEEIGKILRRQ